jgi:hypothetical protein
MEDVQDIAHRMGITQLPFGATITLQEAHVPRAVTPGNLEPENGFD